MIHKIGTNVNIANKSENSNNQSNAGFGNYLMDALKGVNKLELEADALTKKLAAGEKVDIHEVMIATEKANVALQMTIQVRNKAVEAYNEIMRMQV